MANRIRKPSHFTLAEKTHNILSKLSLKTGEPKSKLIDRWAYDEWLRRKR